MGIAYVYFGSESPFFLPDPIATVYRILLMEKSCLLGLVKKQKTITRHKMDINIRNTEKIKIEFTNDDIPLLAGVGVSMLGLSHAIAVVTAHILS